MRTTRSGRVLPESLCQRSIRPPTPRSPAISPPWTAGPVLGSAPQSRAERSQVGLEGQWLAGLPKGGLIPNKLHKRSADDSAEKCGMRPIDSGSKPRRYKTVLARRATLQSPHPNQAQEDNARRSITLCQESMPDPFLAHTGMEGFAGLRPWEGRTAWAEAAG